MHLRAVSLAPLSLNPELQSTPEKFTARFATQEELLKFASDNTDIINDSFISQAYQRGDKCFALFDGDRIASYGWYSTESTNISKNLVLHFSDAYVYMYNGFTAPNYRGQRLHAFGMAAAMSTYVAQGYKGLVSYIEAHNFSSIQSCKRLGYRFFGNVFVFRFFGRRYVVGCPGCTKYDFRVTVNQPARDKKRGRIFKELLAPRASFQRTISSREKFQNLPINQKNPLEERPLSQKRA